MGSGGTPILILHDIDAKMHCINPPEEKVGLLYHAKFLLAKKNNR
jgi:hypothetical protein